MVVIVGWKEWSVPPSFSGVLFHSMTSKIKKSSLPLRGARTGNTNLRYHLACRRSGRSSRCQHTGCPLTLAMRQKILRAKPCSHCPLRPICCPAFRSALSTRNSLWMRLAALLPLHRFRAVSIDTIEPHFRPFVKHYFPPPMDCGRRCYVY